MDRPRSFDYRIEILLEKEMVLLFYWSLPIFSIMVLIHLLLLFTQIRNYPLTLVLCQKKADVAVQ